MKTKSILIFLSCLFISHNSFSQEVSAKQVAFVNKFVTAVIDHDEKTIFNQLDKSYKSEQLAFLNGNKKQLLDELFNGEDLAKPDKYLNFKISEITKFEIAEVIALKGNEGYTYIFKAQRGDQEIFCSLRFSAKGKKFGFIGGRG